MINTGQIQITPGGTSSVPGSLETATNAEQAAGTSTSVASTPASVASVYAYNTIFVPASAMTATTTNGALYGETELASNDLMKCYYAFDATTEEFVTFDVVMPENWDRGTVKAKFYWSSASGSTATTDTVEWEIGGVAISDNDALDAAITGAQVITDTLLANDGADLQVTSATPAITIAGTPALGDLVTFKISRNVGGTDNMTEDAWLFACLIQYKAANSVSAW